MWMLLISREIYWCLLTVTTKLGPGGIISEFCLYVALPDITVHDVTSDHEFIILACDGIWDVLSSQEVVDFVRVRVAQQMAPEIVSVCFCAWQMSLLISDNHTVVLQVMVIGALTTYTVWVKKNPPMRGSDIFHFFHKQLRIFNRLFTHLLYVPIYARLQIFIQLSPILTKLCHIIRDYPVHVIYSECPPSAETRAFIRLHKSLIALLIVVCGKSL